MQSCIIALLGLALSVTAATWSYGADSQPPPKVPLTTAEAMRSVLDDLGGKFFFFLFCALCIAILESLRGSRKFSGDLEYSNTGN